MNNSDGIVVYRSEAERAFDQWAWHDGGWVWVMGFCLLMLVWFVVRSLCGETPRPRRRI